MSEMVERVALAAWIAYRVRPEDMESTEEGDYNRAAAIRDWNEMPDLCTHIGADGFRECARAAISAMHDLPPEIADNATSYALNCWHSIIDAALGNTPPPSC